MSDDGRRAASANQAPTEPPPAMGRDEWIAYLAGRETPAYSGWADNLPEPWRDAPPATPQPPAKDGE